MRNNSKRFIFNVILILLPFIIIGVLELALRLFNYGYNTSLYYKAKYVSGLYLENIEAYNKFTSTKVKGSRPLRLTRNVMAVTKTSNSLRGFVLGESAAGGFPFSSNHSFTKIMERSLALTNKYDSVEIQNLGVTAVTSYCIDDLSSKIKKYKPDFILIYAGNNEYYGYDSYVTGGSHTLKKLSIKSKELKIVQFISDLLPKQDVDRSKLMESMFKQNYIPKNEKIDKLVAENYIKNIDAIIKRFSKSNVPVFVVEPVCNLYSMPPFSGENDLKYQPIIEKYYGYLKNNDTRKLTGFYNDLQGDSNCWKNANILYLDALIQKQKGKNDISKFISAKDYDRAPFRPRTNLLKKLKDYCANNKTRYANLHYIVLSDLLTKQFGNEILSNIIFLDHVHFNHLGNIILADILSSQLASYYQFNKSQKAILKNFYSDHVLVNQSIYYLPFHQMKAYALINKLQQQEPYKSMLIKYHYDIAEKNDAVRKLPPDFLKYYQMHNEPTDIFPLTEYYYNHGEYQLGYLYFKSERFQYPGTCYMSLNLAKYLANFPKYKELAKENFRMAYLLSDKDKEYEKEMDNFNSLL